MGLAIAAIVSFILVWLFPLEIGQGLGATAIAFFAFGNLIPIGSFLIMRSQDAGFPIISTFLLIAILSSLNNDNHAVPLLPGNIDEISSPLHMDDAVDEWLAANPEDTGRAVPIVIVATAGGGLRAAYWTATVLGALQDACPQFAQRTFAISGVSGGSVGAAVFAARLANEPAEAAAVCDSERNRKRTPTFVQRVLTKDFLGPTVATMLFPDLTQRFIPYAFLPSRGLTLANAWDDAWAKVCASDPACKKAEAEAEVENTLKKPFLSLRPWKKKGEWRPALLLNGTHQETGKRIITSHIKITRDVFFDAYDTHHVLKRDVALSIAALNSARFTYVTPPGTLIDAEGKNFGHVLDGGYFENNGAITSMEVLLRLLERSATKGRRIRPIVIQITSDPNLKRDDQSKPSRAPVFLNIDKRPALFVNEATGPIYGILATRTARGVLAGKTLAQATLLLDKIAARFPNFVAHPVPWTQVCLTRRA